MMTSDVDFAPACLGGLFSFVTIKPDFQTLSDDSGLLLS
jgi:hypothetical protein